VLTRLEQTNLDRGRGRQRRRENGVIMAWHIHTWAKHVFDVHVLDINLYNICVRIFALHARLRFVKKKRRQRSKRGSQVKKDLKRYITRSRLLEEDIAFPFALNSIYKLITYSHHILLFFVG
jgi:hypothetical protein